MKKLKSKLSIAMNGIAVGILEKTNNEMKFTYDSSWLSTPGSRPISLSLPLLEKSFKGDVVYNFFDNLLPDNQQIRTKIQTQFKITRNHPFDILAMIGGDCVGAIQVCEYNNIIFEKKILAEPLEEKAIASILNNYQNSPLGMTDEFKDFRISIAGAQEKTALLKYKNKWQRPLKQTATTHIFKLPIGSIPHQNLDLSESCENEWLCAQIAKEFGLPVAECEIKNFADTKVLVVERFDRKYSQDRKWIMRLPQEDMCQVLGVSPVLKYQADGGPGLKQIMNFLRGSADATTDRDNFFRSQILFWLLAAIDGHAKNFSIFIQPEGQYQLTPLYDILSAHPLIAKKQLQKQKIKMAMALKGKNNHYHWHNVQRRNFLSAAEDANYSIEKAETILDEMLLKIEKVIEKVSKGLPPKFPKHISQPIFEGMRVMKTKLQKNL